MPVSLSLPADGGPYRTGDVAFRQMAAENVNGPAFGFSRRRLWRTGIVRYRSVRRRSSDVIRERGAHEGGLVACVVATVRSGQLGFACPQRVVRALRRGAGRPGIESPITEETGVRGHEKDPTSPDSSVTTGIHSRVSAKTPSWQGKLMLSRHQHPTQEGTFMVNATRAAQHVVVTPDGEGVVSHAGSLLVAELADRLGFTKAASHAIQGGNMRSRRHDPGGVLAQLVVTLLDGGDGLSDLAILRNQPQLFGEVASHPTAWRVISSGWARPAIETAPREAREAACEAGAAPKSVALDFDSTLVTAHSEKEDAAPNYEHGFGFHPLLVFLDGTEEALAAMLRPGNAGANNAFDHEISSTKRSRSCPSNGAADIGQATTPTSSTPVRSGTSRSRLAWRSTFRVREALLLAEEEDWMPATRDGRPDLRRCLGDRAHRADRPLGAGRRSPAHLPAGTSAPRCPAQPVRHP